MNFSKGDILDEMQYLLQLWLILSSYPVWGKKAEDYADEGNVKCLSFIRELA